MQRLELISSAMRVFIKMGLKVFSSGTDYMGSKPDLVVVYPEKMKFYIVEALSSDCINEPMRRLKTSDVDGRARRFCANLHNDQQTAAVAAAVYCDLGRGVDSFKYNQFRGLNFGEMQSYAALIYPLDVAAGAETILKELKFQFKPLCVGDIFHLTLFSVPDTQKMTEYRKFINYMITNSME